MGSARPSTRRPLWHPIPRLTPGAFIGTENGHTSPERQRWDARASDWRPNYFAPNLYAVFFGSKSASVKPLLVFTFM